MRAVVEQDERGALDGALGMIERTPEIIAAGIAIQDVHQAMFDERILVVAKRVQNRLHLGRTAAMCQSLRGG